MALGALAVVLLAGCARYPGQPTGRVRAPGPWPSAVGVPEPEPLGVTATALSFQEGLDGIAEVVAGLRRVPASETPGFFDPQELATSILARHRGRGFGGPLRHALGVAVIARAPLAPGRLADLLVDADVQRDVLAAREVEPIGSPHTFGPARTGRSYHVVKADVGAGPIRVDLVFRVTVERWDAPDGSVWIRYDPRPAGPVEHITYWRGLAIIEPDPQGARLTEVLVVGTDLVVPPFLTGLLRNMARDTLKDARRALLRRAAAPHAR
ncbi:MAG: hypothetical protein AB7T63_15865 [Planctomycetota bacterium]